MKYPVALTRTEEGYSVSCPGLPGCWSQGATEEEERKKGENGATIDAKEGINSRI